MEESESAFVPAAEPEEKRANQDPDNPNRTVDPRDPSQNPSPPGENVGGDENSESDS